MSRISKDHVLALLKHVPEVAWRCSILLDPFYNDGEVVSALMESDLYDFDPGILTNDIDPEKDALFSKDVVDPEFWKMMDDVDWIVTAPPPGYQVSEFLDMSWKHINEGMAIYFVPDDDSAWEGWIEEHSPTHVIVFSKTGNIWMVWDKHEDEVSPRIRIVPE